MANFISSITSEAQINNAAIAETAIRVTTCVTHYPVVPNVLGAPDQKIRVDVCPLITVVLVSRFVLAFPVPAGTPGVAVELNVAQKAVEEVALTAVPATARAER